jgi:hypothetical protein
VLEEKVRMARQLVAEMEALAADLPTVEAMAAHLPSDED